MTIKEIEEIKKKDKQRQQRNVICNKEDDHISKNSGQIFGMYPGMERYNYVCGPT